jgi:5'-nucleotidase
MEYHWQNVRRSDQVQRPESDYTAFRANRIVVTPLRYDRTDEDAYAVLAEKLPRLP